MACCGGGKGSVDLSRSRYDSPNCKACGQDMLSLYVEAAKQRTLGRASAQILIPLACPNCKNMNGYVVTIDRRVTAKLPTKGGS